MIIGLCGEIAAGKDATYLRASEIYGDRFEVARVGFADKMKESIAAIFGLSQEFIELEKRNPLTTVSVCSPVQDDHGNVGENCITLTFREFIQNYGTEAHRGVFGDLFWVDATLPMDFDHRGKIIFVTDTRFATEQQRVVDHGGVNILVQSETVATARETRHSSENGLDMDLIHYTIDNRERTDNFSTLDDQLIDIVDEILELETMEA